MGYSRIDSAGGPHHRNATTLGKRTGGQSTVSVARLPALMASCSLILWTVECEVPYGAGPQCNVTDRHG